MNMSHEFTELGLLERENAAILNACLRPLADHLLPNFEKAFRGKTCCQTLSGDALHALLPRARARAKVRRETQSIDSEEAVCHAPDGSILTSMWHKEEVNTHSWDEQAYLPIPCHHMLTYALQNRHVMLGLLSWPACPVCCGMRGTSQQNSAQNNPLSDGCHWLPATSNTSMQQDVPDV